VERHKLDAMLGFCEVTSCRRQTLLRYFGEDLPEPCGNCDNCLSPPATWDGTEAARKALSCVYRTSQRFGAHHVVDVLLGRASERIERLGHNHLSTFGIGKELDEKQWLSVFRQLITQGYLAVDHEAYGALKLTETCRPVLKGETPLRLRRDEDRKLARREAPNRTSLADPANYRLWEGLRTLRKRLADEQGVPPYVIFHDAVLMEMVQRRPRSLAEFGRLSGIGERKLERYGPDFLNEILQHGAVPPPPLGDTAAASVALLRQGLSVEDIAERRQLKTSTVYDHLAAAIQSGLVDAEEVVNLEPAEAARIERVWRALPDEERRGLKPLYEAFQGKHEYGLLRCLRAGWDRRGE
jgi:ATP-dependent DNA helicase RecQ